MAVRWSTLGTDGFGRTEDRQALRDFFEVDARYVVIDTLAALQQQGELDGKVVAKAIADRGVKADKPNPAIS